MESKAEPEFVELHVLWKGCMVNLSHKTKSSRMSGTGWMKLVSELSAVEKVDSSSS